MPSGAVHPNITIPDIIGGETANNPAHDAVARNKTRQGRPIAALFGQSPTFRENRSEFFLTAAHSPGKLEDLLAGAQR